ncbi:hypothetical protein IJ707_07600 [bacterium]|nr:hypothetical protein [bacterium]
MSVSSVISQMQTNTAIAESKQEKSSSNDITDSNMFLKLMLKQMEQQDPTEPTDNSQWLAQMAQYSSLEAMNNLNASFSEVSNKINELSETVNSSNIISQTLSLVGKDVTVTVPVLDENGKVISTQDISGKVDEVSFENGDGMINLNGNTYSIANIKSIRP